MLNWIKSLFKKSSIPVDAAAGCGKQGYRPLSPTERPSGPPPPPPPPPKRLCPAKSKSDRHRTDDEDFATSLVVGMVTNNAVVGAVVGGSLAGGVVGDLANDGCLGSCSTEPTGSSYDSGSCGDINSNLNQET